MNKSIQTMNSQEILLNNLKIICEFIMCLLATSASVERLFFVIDNYWSDEKSQLKVTTFKETIQVYHEFQ